MFCVDCNKGGKPQHIVGNGITEPPYITVIKCPFDNKYYKNIDDECNQLAPVSEMVGRND